VIQNPGFCSGFGSRYGIAAVRSALAFEAPAAPSAENESGNVFYCHIFPVKLCKRLEKIESIIFRLGQRLWETPSSPLKQRSDAKLPKRLHDRGLQAMFGPASEVAESRTAKPELLPSSILFRTIDRQASPRRKNALKPFQHTELPAIIIYGSLQLTRVQDATPWCATRKYMEKSKEYPQSLRMITIQRYAITLKGFSKTVCAGISNRSGIEFASNVYDWLNSHSPMNESRGVEE
jgi:hypothetical protein